MARTVGKGNEGEGFATRSPQERNDGTPWGNKQVEENMSHKHGLGLLTCGQCEDVERQRLDWVQRLNSIHEHYFSDYQRKLLKVLIEEMEK